MYITLGRGGRGGDKAKGAVWQSGLRVLTKCPWFNFDRAKKIVSVAARSVTAYMTYEAGAVGEKDLTVSSNQGNASLYTTPWASWENSCILNA